MRMDGPLYQHTLSFIVWQGFLDQHNDWLKTTQSMTSRMPLSFMLPNEEIKKTTHIKDYFKFKDSLVGDASQLEALAAQWKTVFCAAYPTEHFQILSADVYTTLVFPRPADMVELDAWRKINTLMVESREQLPWMPTKTKRSFMPVKTADEKHLITFAGITMEKEARGLETFIKTEWKKVADREASVVRNAKNFNIIDGFEQNMAEKLQKIGKAGQLSQKPRV